MYKIYLLNFLAVSELGQVTKVTNDELEVILLDIAQVDRAEN